MNILLRLVSSTAVLVFASSALAADIQVPGDFNTIQDAVNAAGVGDCIVVKSGVYLENPTVATNGLILRAQGSAIIDGQFRGPCLTVVADDVTIEGFGLINGGDPMGTNACVSYTGAGAVLRKNDLLAGAGTGLAIDGADALVARNRIVGCAGTAILVDGGDLESQTFVENNAISACAAGIEGNAGRVDVLRNTLSELAGAGIVLTPSINVLTSNVESLVERNTLTLVDGTGIDVSGSSGATITVRANRLGRVAGEAIAVSATGVTEVDVVQNRVRGVAGDGILVSVSGGRFFLGFNTLQQVDGDAIDATAGSNGGRAEKNGIRDAGGVGLLGTGNGIILRQNRITTCVGAGISLTGNLGSITRNSVRSAAQDGIRYVGNSGTLNENAVSDSGRDGLLVSGSSNTIRDNRSRANGGDGIDLEELDLVLNNTGNEILDNTCIGNAHEGIDNTGLNTVIEGNTARGNAGAVGPDVAGAGNDVDGDDVADGTVASFVDNSLSPAKGDFDPGDEFTAQRLDLGVPAPMP